MDHYHGLESGDPGESSSAITSTPEEDAEIELLRKHLDLLKNPKQEHGLAEISNSPIFSRSVLRYAEAKAGSNEAKPFSQYGLLGGRSHLLDDLLICGTDEKADPRVFFNVAAPSSTFICGSQGSGKSHTLSCLLENCLMSSDAGVLPSPLTGLVFHYDAFISDDGGSPCEAAFLASHPGIKVRILCAPTNIATIRTTYRRLGIEVMPLEIPESNLNTKRILELMAVKSDEPIPLYIHTIYRILREMRLVQQAVGGKFNYQDFKRQVLDSSLSPAQLGPLTQRLETLESFMPKTQLELTKKQTLKKKSAIGDHDTWAAKPGRLTIVDLSCPCVTPESACSLFNICLSLFIENGSTNGQVIALDEAHKYMNASAEAQTLTDSLLSVIRLQRHLGARVVISTQEPTISPKLLDLCSVTITHRFTSPAWMVSLRQHLAGITSHKDRHSRNDEEAETISKEDVMKSDQLFERIVRLHVGEALLFAPSAITEVAQNVDSTLRPIALGSRHLKVLIRNRLTTDGGASVMAT